MTEPARPWAAAGLRMGTARARWVLLATVLGSGMAMLDATVVNVALARIGADLHAGFTALQWVVNAYTLTLGGLILLGGSLGDRLGRRRMFVLGVVWFAAASLLCGLAPDARTLIAARALQGVGGALLTPGSLAIISASFRGADRSAAVGAWSGLGGIAGALGPFLGGWLVEWTWRAVFWINLPVAAVVVAVAARHVPESRDDDAAGPPDLAGALGTLLGLGGITYALTASGRVGAAPAVLLWGAVGVLALAGTAVVQRRAANPLLPPDLLRTPQFLAANAVTLLVYAALGALFVLLVLQLQVVSGFGPLPAGLSLLPVTLIMLAFSARAGVLARRVGPRLPMTIGPIVAACGVALMLRIGPAAGYLTDVLPAVGGFGAGLALTVAPLTSAVLDAAGDRHAGAASAVNNAVARVAGLLAVAVVPAVSGLARAQGRAAFAGGFRRAVLIEAGLLVAGGVLAGLTIRNPQPQWSRRDPVEERPQCGVPGPALHPVTGGAAPTGSADEPVP
jgi:EmrB/QacA subfamily drug resistance transporter